MKVSVLTPTLNRPVFLRLAVKSVLDQTHEDWELIVHNVGDRVIVVDDPRIIYSEGDRLGPAGDFQACLDLATGELVTPLSDDDKLTKWALQTAVERIEDHDWLCGRTMLVQNGYPLAYRGGIRDDVEVTRAGSYMLGGAIYWRKTLTDRLGGFSTDFDGAADFDLYTRFLADSEPALTREIMYLYTDHPDTDSRVNFERQSDAHGRVSAKR